MSLREVARQMDEAAAKENSARAASMIQDLIGRLATAEAQIAQLAATQQYTIDLLMEAGVFKPAGEPNA